MYNKLPFRPVDDFSMISMIAEFPYVLATYSDHPVRGVADLISVSRAARDPLLYGTSGVGSAQHLLMEWLAQMAKVKFQHVPYRGGAQSLTELLGKRIDLMVDAPTIMVEQVNSGKIRYLAVTTAARAAAMPDIPTVAEAGFADFDIPGWQGLAAPAGLPEPIAKRLNSELAAILAEPAIGERLRAVGSGPSPSIPDKLKARISSDIAKWNKVIDAAKIERI
jgi:tripartite-type tricarboxylate transporter receptor subunit TctC